MFFKNRKKVIIYRGHIWTEYDKDVNLIISYYTLFIKITKWFPFNIFVHKILKSDLGDLHDHYWSYITVILAGGYVETTEKGSYSRKPGYIGFRKADDRHSLKLNNEKPAWTLIFVGPNNGAKSHGKYSSNSKKS